MSERWFDAPKAIAETLAPYGADAAVGAHTKLSVSLPTELVELVREAATESGTSVSGMIAAALRRTLEDAEQVRLDAAIEAQNEENLEWAEAHPPIAAKLWSEIEW
jgi:Arc/MetJ-type ribon-helix-helix transcriptional regulator